MPLYDLEERTMEFAIAVRLFLRTLPRNDMNREDSRQLVRASGSIGANYIEANERLGDKDFLMRTRIARKEAKESLYWLNILKRTNDKGSADQLDTLIQEASEIRKILSAIINKRS